jgi:hypothetical protein
MRQPISPYCQKEFQPSIYHPNQAVCSAVACQRRRAMEYHKRKVSKDAAYRALCKESRKYWREKNPGYARAYRLGRKHEDGAGDPELAEFQKLLNSVKNSAAKNNSAILVTRCNATVISISQFDPATGENTSAIVQAILFQGVSSPGIA